MSTIGERIKAMNLHRVKKGDELSSQQYEQDMSFPYKNNKTILLKNKIPLACMMN